MSLIQRPTMGRRPRLFAPGVLYHVIVRGNQRQKTFLNDRDYRAYLDRLAKYRRKYNYSVHAYCLMPNHVHLLVESSAHPLAKFMQGLQQSYTQYFNLKYHKTGHLFEGRYKAIICEKDEYLLEVRYIHLNPVRAAIVKNPGQYPYSGHHAYLQGKNTEIIDPTPVFELLGGERGYRRFVHDGLRDGHKEEYYAVEDQRFLGTEGFRKKMANREPEQRSRTGPRRSIGAVVKQLAAELDLGISELRGPSRSWALSKTRTMIGYVLARKLGYPLNEVAAYFRRDIATAATLLGRMEARMSENKQLRDSLERLSENVESSKSDP